VAGESQTDVYNTDIVDFGNDTAMVVTYAGSNILVTETATTVFRNITLTNSEIVKVLFGKD